MLVLIKMARKWDVQIDKEVSEKHVCLCMRVCDGVWWRQILLLSDLSPIRIVTCHFQAWYV